MAEETGGGNPWGEVIVLLVFLAIIVTFWFVSGASKRTPLGALFVPSPVTSGGTASTTRSSPSNLPFLIGGGTPSVPFTPSQSAYVPGQNQYAPANQQNLTVLPGMTRSPYSGEVTISDYTGAHSSVPSGEYVTIYANYANAGPINISGWRLQSAVTGQRAYIGGGMETPVLAQPIQESAIMLNPGDTAVLTTGYSPIGTSFRENKCEGYIAGFQRFTPPLAQACPLPQNELSLGTNPQLAQDPACVAAVAQLQPCQTLTYAPPNIGSACSNFIVPRFTYNGCVAAHHTDQDFAGRQWRIFLDQNSELWNNQTDIIALLDAKGQLVSAVSY